DGSLTKGDGCNGVWGVLWVGFHDFGVGFVCKGFVFFWVFWVGVYLKGGVFDIPRDLGGLLFNFGGGIGGYFNGCGIVKA
ncbi:hypothetical protein, partial [Pseudomonas aeruginosa]|uniref:hypothetical protein n=1 Tax=Pseudomonas aeruginosa TaxID=287 RepID=UPI003CC590D6